MSVLPTLAENSIDSCVTDPPYHLTSIVKRFGKTSQADETQTSDRARRGADGMARLSRGFMGKEWDGGDIAFRVELWREVYRVLKPGAHLLAFGAPRNFGFMQVAIAEAGFEIRDTVLWLFGSGFPKSHDVSKGIDRAAGAEREVVGRRSGALNNAEHSQAKSFTAGDVGWQPEFDITAPATPAARQWEGWGTALKPAAEFVCLARKPLGEKTVAANVLRHGTGGLNIDGCRVESGPDHAAKCASVVGLASPTTDKVYNSGLTHPREDSYSPLGRWPANVIHDGSEEVIAAFPDVGVSTGGQASRASGYGEFGGGSRQIEKRDPGFGDSGSAARFFYSSKADSDDRLGSKHPTVKPVDLMAYLCRLVTPPGGTVLDPFAGSGTTGMACMREGFDCILIEREEEYVADIHKRLAHVHGTDTPLFDDWQAKDSQANYELALQEMRNR